MFEKFTYERIPLSLIKLDEKNPRIVSFRQPETEQDIIKYFFEHENMAAFLKKIASEGRNKGAERPYVVKSGKNYVVVEGNTRIACYKLLTKQLSAPEEFDGAVPHVPEAIKEDLLSVDCTIAPSRDSLLPIMAASHFGVGDKSKWGYLGSRKAVYDEMKTGKSISQLAHAFDRKKGQIRDLILEFELYLAALDLGWTDAEKEELINPSVEFNPPVRFLQTTGHRSAIGVDYDRTNLKVLFDSADAKSKFKHLVKKLVIEAEKGLGATATYEDVFEDYKPESVTTEKVTGVGGDKTSECDPDGGSPSPTGSGSGEPTSPQSDATPASDEKKIKLKKGALFNYPVTSNNALIIQLMKEAKDIDSTRFPAAGTALLRCIVEGILKNIIEDQGANPQNLLLSLERCLDICLTQSVNLSQDDKKLIKEFKKHHVDYVNLGTHATQIPNHLRLMGARDCIDQFVMRNV